jgi:oxalate decarboxylase/phosphoglucose isomerase-like protein (cupin superfamily)
MGGEKHIITKTCLIFVPRGIIHSPVTLNRIDTPIFMFEAANRAAYEKVMNG